MMMMMKCDDDHYLKPWPNGLEISRMGLLPTPFGHQTQVNASLATSICNTNLLANEILDISALRWRFFSRLAFTSEKTCKSVLPPNRKFNLRLLATSCESV